MLTSSYLQCKNWVVLESP
uniref:Uncharacterized protein n=1 Tax=Arundo donax TaxID=35708 RepID=A0A0A9CH76_ARUDO